MTENGKDDQEQLYGTLYTTYPAHLLDSKGKAATSVDDDNGGEGNNKGTGSCHDSPTTTDKNQVDESQSNDSVAVANREAESDYENDSINSLVGSVAEKSPTSSQNKVTLADIFKSSDQQKHRRKSSDLKLGSLLSTPSTSPSSQLFDSSLLPPTMDQLKTPTSMSPKRVSPTSRASINLSVPSSSTSADTKNVEEQPQDEEMEDGPKLDQAFNYLTHRQRILTSALTDQFARLFNLMNEELEITGSAPNGYNDCLHSYRRTKNRLDSMMSMEEQTETKYSLSELEMLKRLDPSIVSIDNESTQSLLPPEPVSLNARLQATNFPLSSRTIRRSEKPSSRPATLGHRRLSMSEIDSSHLSHDVSSNEVSTLADRSHSRLKWSKLSVIKSAFHRPKRSSTRHLSEHDKHQNHASLNNLALSQKQPDDDSSESGRSSMVSIESTTTKAKPDADNLQAYLDSCDFITIDELDKKLAWLDVEIAAVKNILEANRRLTENKKHSKSVNKAYKMTIKKNQDTLAKLEAERQCLLSLHKRMSQLSSDQPSTQPDSCSLSSSGSNSLPPDSQSITSLPGSVMSPSNLTCATSPLSAKSTTCHRRASLTPIRDELHGENNNDNNNRSVESLVATDSSTKCTCIDQKSSIISSTQPNGRHTIVRSPRSSMTPSPSLTPLSSILSRTSSIQSHTPPTSPSTLTNGRFRNFVASPSSVTPSHSPTPRSTILSRTSPLKSQLPPVSPLTPTNAMNQIARLSSSSLTPSPSPTQLPRTIPLKAQILPVPTSTLTNGNHSLVRPRGSRTPPPSLSPLSRHNPLQSKIPPASLSIRLKQNLANDFKLLQSTSKNSPGETFGGGSGHIDRKYAISNGVRLRKSSFDNNSGGRVDVFGNAKTGTLIDSTPGSLKSIESETEQQQNAIYLEQINNAINSDLW